MASVSFPPGMARHIGCCLTEDYVRSPPGSVNPGLLEISREGELLNWHPHVHLLVSDGVFDRDGTFERFTLFDTRDRGGRERQRGHQRRRRVVIEASGEVEG